MTCLISSLILALALTTIHGQPIIVKDAEVLPPITTNPLDLQKLMDPEVVTSPKGKCIGKLEQEFKNNDAYFSEIQGEVDAGKIDEAYEIFVRKAKELCALEQVERLRKLLKKYENLQANVQNLASGYPVNVRHDVLNWMRDGDLMALMNFLGREGMASMVDPQKSSKLMQTSFDLTAMQIELFFNPI
uniref:Uncharacterized protein n=1 Tax=Haemonchus contortus TaxID=6289 RepID=A0A7I4Y7D2_HAECO